MHSSKFLSIVLAGRTIPNRLCCQKKIELDKNFDDEPWKQIGRSSPAVSFQACNAEHRLFGSCQVANSTSVEIVCTKWVCLRKGYARENDSPCSIWGTPF